MQRHTDPSTLESVQAPHARMHAYSRRLKAAEIHLSRPIVKRESSKSRTSLIDRECRGVPALSSAAAAAAAAADDDPWGSGVKVDGTCPVYGVPASTGS